MKKEPKYVAETLAWCNKRRKEQGKRPLKKMPKGRMSDPSSCPGGAIKIPLADFHSSPAKGRLFSLGFKLRHRVLPDKAYVAAWLEEPIQKETEL
jgi:hypothetical protein